MEVIGGECESQTYTKTNVTHTLLVSQHYYDYAVTKIPHLPRKFEVLRRYWMMIRVTQRVCKWAWP